MPRQNQSPVKIMRWNFYNEFLKIHLGVRVFLFLFFFLAELRRDEEQSDMMRFIKPKLEVVSAACATGASLKKK